jgi:hypothetical protein
MSTYEERKFRKSSLIFNRAFPTAGTPMHEWKLQTRYAEQGNWIRYVLSHRYSERLEAFSYVLELLPDTVYWPLLRRVERTVWQWYKRPLLARLMRVRAGSELFMFPAERKFYQEQPELLLVFRGHGPRSKGGLGVTYYTMNQEHAEAWARTHGTTDVDAQALPKRDCLILGCGVEVLHVEGLGNARDIYEGKR